MSIEKGFIWVNDVEATAVVPPEGHIVYARDTDTHLASDGTVLTALGGGGAFNTEDAQDAVGAMVDSTLTYDDATPTLKIATDGVGNTQLRNSAALSVIGRSANSTGDPADIAGATVGHVLQVLSGPTIGFGANGVRRPSWDNPPASPHAYDDEFDTGTLDAKWTITSTGTTNPATSGTIDYSASLTTPIVDAATIPSWLAFQCDNSSLKSFSVYQTVSLATDATFFAKIGGQSRDPSTGSEGDFFVSLRNSGDSNEWFNFGVSRNTSTGGCLGQISNNGALTTFYNTDFNNNGTRGASYIAIWKKTNTYYMGVAGDNGIFTYLGSFTKTGVTTFDILGVGYYSTTANETPSVIDGIDFFRYKASLDYSLVNP